MKRFLVYLFMIVIAIITGHYLGNVCAGSNEYVSWLAKSLNFGMDVQKIDMNVFQLTFGYQLSINFLQIFLIAIAIAAAPSVMKAIK